MTSYHDSTVDIDKDAAAQENKTPYVKGPPFFRGMARYPWPFLVLVPAIFVVILAIGWTTVDDKVEQEVARLWIAQEGDYAADIEYATALGVEDLGSTSFAAMAMGRDAGNMLTAERLALMRERMEKTEGTTIVYKGISFTWDDFCSVNPSPYLLPCLRLSPMDLFQEARWTFTTPNRIAWYRGIVKRRLLAPRLGRFGALEPCAAQCGELIQQRTLTGQGMKLFSDVGNLEYNHPCKICIEAAYDKTITDLYNMIIPVFQNLRLLVLAHTAALPTDDEATQQQRAANEQIAANLEKLYTALTTDDVVDFYIYYVTRILYSQMGIQSYLTSYAGFASYIDQCIAAQPQAQALGLNVVCPTHPADMNATRAQQDLLRHADNTFSSVTTAGAPFPFWSAPDGTGVLFQAGQDDRLWPVSGSGIDMSADVTSIAVYVATTAATGTTADPTSQTWKEQVETNPLYAWFMASLTPADPATVCANGNLTGSPLSPSTSEVVAAFTPRWCTPFDVPNPTNPGPVPTYTKQHFARMWFDLLISSDSFLGITQGSDDPYSWTTGAGCGYSLGDERYTFTDQREEDILSNSSRLVYNIDEGVSLGPIDPHLLLGGVTPPIGEYSMEKPLKEVKVLQNLYGALLPRDIIKRLQDCNRPGGPVDLTEDEARELLEIWKEAMENSWNEGWDDDNDGPVQFISFFDDGGGTIGSTGRMLTEITLDNTTLTLISILLIAFFSALFLFSFDLVESRILITLIGVGLAVLSFFAALGFALLTGTKINVTVGWTLPFVIIGLGVDDVYIILLALKKQGGYTLQHWLHAMEEIVVPVTMTSLVNVSMFAVLRFVSDIPAIYLTSQVALYCVVALYLSVIFCFPAYCYLDMIRQGNNRVDVVCVKSSNPARSEQKEDFRNTLLYDSFYKPIVLGNSSIRYFFHAVIVVIGAALLAVGAYGVTDRSVGLGLADFFPSDNPAGRWAEIGGEVMASWVIAMNWGALNYTNPTTQMKMIKSFENVVADPRVGEIDTKQLWMADFLLWTSRHCDSNFDRPVFEVRMCGRDQVVPDEVDSICAGSWATNSVGLRLKNIASVLDDETCIANLGGICRLGEEMHPFDLAELGLTIESAKGMEFCPIVDGWSDSKWQFCLGRWRDLTGGSGRLLTKPGESKPNTCGGFAEENGKLVWPIPYSYSPTMFSFDVFTHEQTLAMMRDTRAHCDDNEDIHCWLGGIPYDYWTQYENIFNVLLEMCGYATLSGFVIGFAFLFGKLLSERNHGVGKVIVGSLIGATLMACTMILTLTTVIGLSILSGVNLTGFSNMSFVLSVGFTVEYTVHIISRWMRASMAHKSSLERVDFTMSFLMLPTFMSFVSSTIGTICLAFTVFDFVHVFFFRPLIIVMFVSYFYGCWFLPVVLTYLDFDFVKVGPEEDYPLATEANNAEPGGK